MAKAKKPEDEQNPQPQGDPGGEQGGEFLASGPIQTGTPEQPQEETPVPATGEGEKPKTIVLGPGGQPVKGPEYEPETPTASPAEAAMSKLGAALKQDELSGKTLPEVPSTFKHKSGIEIPYTDFDDENVVWAEKYDPQREQWDAKKFSRIAWDKTTAGKARKYRAQSHSGWSRMAPALPEWSSFDEEPEGGEGRVGPRPGDRNNP